MTVTGKPEAFPIAAALALSAALSAALPVDAAGTGAPATARPPLSGTWAIRIVQPATGCDWTGQVRLTEQAGKLNGSGSASPSAASRDRRFCPPLKGEVDGTVRGEVVRFGFATGQLGTAEFDGRLEPQAKAMQGSWRARAAAGEWAAAR